MRQFLEDAYSFATSFVFPRKSPNEDHEMKTDSGSKNLMLMNQA